MRRGAPCPPEGHRCVPGRAWEFFQPTPHERASFGSRTCLSASNLVFDAEGFPKIPDSLGLVEEDRREPKVSRLRRPTLGWRPQSLRD
ncbi:MAG: hypothetical protein FLDDKLPJ_01225 [Phycisphaerae bacterium]|nr:hypothetical protein [Phycisphaerae bacterium]